ncbi:MAG: nitrogen fixation protein NifM [Halochromatium sp.]|nr:nitrogen fixation protein NifM [Halochromatium sp.]
MSPSQAIAPKPAASDQHRAEPEGYRYHLLRAATARYQRNIPALAPAELAEAERQARRSFALEEQVLNSAEARDVFIPDTQVQRAYQAVKARYQSQAELEADLARNQLSPRQLRQALGRELRFDAVMQRVGARHTPITDADERLFYELHRERFTTPETRSARHILITINEDYPENSRATARARIEAIAERLKATEDQSPSSKASSSKSASDQPSERQQRFSDEARKGSECPTAMDGGQLGQIRQGQLYPALDAALFNLDQGAISGILESELGFHLLFCEAIHAANSLPFSQVRERIHEALEQRRRKDQQRQWLASHAS